MTPAVAPARGNGAPVPVGERCVLCGCRLTTAYAIDRGLCGSCSDRPEAKQLVRDPVTGRPMSRPLQKTAPPVRPPRDFTPAEQSLIKKLHALVPIRELLQILNDRMHADVGLDAPAYTLEQLQTALPAVEPTAQDWAGLRTLLARARTAGTLDAITLQTIDDFAIVFSLSSAQVMHLRDVIRHAKEEA